MHSAVDCEKLFTQTRKISEIILCEIWVRSYETQTRSNKHGKLACQSPRAALELRIQGAKSIRSKYRDNVFYSINEKSKTIWTAQRLGDKKILWNELLKYANQVSWLYVRLVSTMWKMKDFFVT